MATLQRQAAIQKEGRIELALQAYQQGQFSTSITAAKMYDVMRSTLQQCIINISSKLDSISKKHLLMSTEEESLVQWILLMNQCSMLSRIAIIWEMTHLLVTQCFKSIISSLIDQNWVQKFINCHDTLKLKYNCKYDVEIRRLCRGFQSYSDLAPELAVSRDAA